DELCHVLSDAVAKFRADTGIACSFSADVAQVSLPPATCPVVVRIVQEALSNVRKHSGARNVLVDIRETRGQWRLVIEDDGGGLDATVATPSPLVIRECVKSLDGDLHVLRTPGGGLRLEIAFTGYLPSADLGEFARLVGVTEPAKVSMDAGRIYAHAPQHRRVV